MPTRKDAVAIPTSLWDDSRMANLVVQLGHGKPYAAYILVTALAAIADAGGDASAVDFPMVLGGVVPAGAFKELFLDNGRCPLYDEYNGARDRHRAANRAWRERAKRPAPKPKGSLFPEAWKAYPKRSGGNPRTLAEKAWNARVKEGVREQEMLAATRHYAAHCEQEKKTGTTFVLQGGTFYGPSRRWEDFTASPPDPELDDIMAEIRRSFEEE